MQTNVTATSTSGSSDDVVTISLSLSLSQLKAINRRAGIRWFEGRKRAEYIVRCALAGAASRSGESAARPSGEPLG
jgi:hypothetical protein